MSNYQDVRTWMTLAGQTVREHDQWTPFIGPRDRALRIRLMKEELGELINAMEIDDQVEIADGIADLLYVVYGTAATYGMDADALFAEAHKSNMSKFEPDGPIFDEGGKVLKGSGYRPPQFGVVLTNQKKG